MVGFNSSLEIARRALQAHQLAMNVIGSNIANANTPGYARKTARLETAPGMPTAAGMVGAGVDTVDVRRARDTVLDDHFRKHSGEGGRWRALHGQLSRIESVIGEPGEGLGEALTEFWNSWDDLANDPSDTTRRAVVRRRGQEMTEAFHRLDDHLRTLQDDIATEQATQLNRLNRLGGRLASLNQQIATAEVEGREASDLRDERDRALDEISEIALVRTEEQENGAVTVYLGSEMFVQEGTHRELRLHTEPGGTPEVVWAKSSRQVAISGGLLEGLDVASSTNIASYREDLDKLAEAVVLEVNRIHSTGSGLDGSTGVAFFSSNGTHASDMALSATVAGSLDSIAAAFTGAAGDGDGARSIADLRHEKLFNAGTTSMDGLFRDLVGRIGLDVNEAASNAGAEEMVLLDVEARRLEVSGVSLDEEMTNLLSHQHAYEAMLRVTTAIEEMNDLLMRSL